MNPSCSWKVNGYCHSVTSPPVFQPLSSTPQRSLRSNVWRKAGEGFANRKGLCTVLNMIYITRPTILKRLAVFQALSFLHWSRMWCVADYVPLTLCLNSGETRGEGGSPKVFWAGKCWVIMFPPIQHFSKLSMFTFTLMYSASMSTP